MLGRQITLIPCLVAALILGGCHEAKSEPWTPSVPGDNSGRPEDKPDDGQDVNDGQTYFISSVEEFVELTLAPGDVVVWKNGTYNAVTAKLKAKGAEGSPVVLKAETPGNVIFTGSSSMSLGGSWFHAEGFAWKELDSSMKTSVMTCAKGSCHCTFENCL
ncbi:MAG: chondroitinase-B domain-containing protein, partial [Candidatus Cryptobacteroides sp.]